MTASQKLKALEAATPLEKYEINLFGVLPQIIALVEAVARSAPTDKIVGPYEYVRGDELYGVRVTLTALEDALP